MDALIFYGFGGLVILAAVMVITARNPVHAVLFLVLAFFGCSALWITLEAELLAITLVLVYVGAVMVLFLFVVMMLDINVARLREGFASYLPLGLLVAASMMVAIGLVVGSGYFGLERVPAPEPAPADYSNTARLGTALYTEYVFPFEVAAVVLLVAIVAAIALTMRPRRQTKAQRPEEQVAVTRDERLRLVRIEPEQRS